MSQIINFFRKNAKPEENKDYYLVGAICYNCKKQQNITIPIKINAEEYIKKHKCRFCCLKELTQHEDIFKSFKDMGFDFDEK